MKIRYKFFLGFFMFNLVISSLLGYSMYKITYDLFFEQFRQSKLSLARSIASSIDGNKHAGWNKEEAYQDPEYQLITRYLESIFKREEYIKYLYTVNYVPESDSFQYVTSGNKMPKDTLWCEADFFAFSVSTTDDGKLVVDYDDSRYTAPFQTIDGKNTTKISFTFGTVNGNQALFANGSVILEMISADPFQIKLPNHTILTTKNITDEGAMLIGGQKMKYNFSMSEKGKYDLFPGMPVVNDNLGDLKTVIKESKEFSDLEFKRDNYGSFFNVRVPILNNSGKPIGLVEMNFSEKQIIKFRDSVKNVLLKIFFFSFLLTLMVSSFISYYFAKPIKQLIQSSDLLAKGDYSHRIQFHSSDEFGILANSFNNMANEIENYSSTLINSNKAFRRFVPEQFLMLLNKKSILDIELGDQTQKEMSVLFSDIRSFTTLSEQMTPEENFKFLNSYLNRMGPIIRKHGGFIDKYIGDAIMALFPNEAEDALMAAVEMQEEVYRYNKLRISYNLVPINIGIGIHTGSLILGTIGENERMDSTVISDSVNLASRLEGLTKYYGSKIIITDFTLSKIKNLEKYNYRLLDKVKVKGKNLPVNLIDIIDGFPKEEIIKFTETKKEFELAIIAYNNKDFEKALIHFSRIIEIHPEDKAAKVYLDRVNQFIHAGVPEEWEGVSEMDFK